MDKLKRAARVVGFISTGGGWVAIVFMWLLALLTFSDVMSRLFFHGSVPGNLELASVFLVSIVFMGAAWTLKSDGHVQIGLLSSHLSPRGQRWLTLFMAMASIFVIGFIAVYAWQGLAEFYVKNIISIESDLYLHKWWTWVPFLLGLVLLMIQFGAVIVEQVIFPKASQEQGQGSPVLLIALWVILIGVSGYLLASPQASKMAIWLVLLVMFGLVLGLILGGMWIFAALTLAGLLGLVIFTPLPVGTIAAKVYYNANYSFVLTPLPLFILMGEFLLRSGATEHLYSGLSSWVSKIPGGLLHSNVLSCTVFAAVSSSSAATCATIGSVAVPELKKRGYSMALSVGSLAGAGTLGLLIPPSIVMIVYGAMAAESIGQLYLAGIFPGLLLSLLFMLYIMVVAIVRPSVAPPAGSYTWGDRMRGIVDIMPILVLIGLVLGLIYLGVSTPTEAGAIGAVGAFGTLILYRRLNWKSIKESSKAALLTTCMIMMIIAGAILLSSSIAFLRVPQYISNIIAASGLSKWWLFTIVCIFYVLLGCLLEGISMMVLTLPIIYPIMMSMGFNGVWFGVVLTILIETAQVTPPVGFNLFVLETITGESIGMIARNAFPFFVLMLVLIVILSFFPQIALVLPNMMIIR